MKTYRRDKLRRLIEAGRVVKTSSYHYDDMTGAEQSDKEMPVRMREDREPWEAGVGKCSLYGSDLRTSSGCCYVSGPDPDRITLIVHSNCSFEFRILPEAMAS